jgi:hypothetical protein
MGKRLILVLAIALVVCSMSSAFAAVQNIKVSGDILMRAIDRQNFTLNEADKYHVSGFTSQTRVRFDADLTDNVSACVRLLNERSWGNDNGGNLMGGPGIMATPITTTGDEVVVDLAYVSLKEFLYSPLSFTIGRQELRFGNALIIGDVDTNSPRADFIPYANEWQIPWDLSLRKSFDAVRATLNYEPLVVDVIYAKINENDVWWGTVGPAGIFGLTPAEKNDVDLYGVNASYDMSALGFKGTTDLYWFSKINRWGSANNPLILPPPLGPQTLKKDSVNTIGFLTRGQIVNNLTSSLEAAFQFGNSAWDGINNANAKRRAWALQVTANYDLKDVKTIGKYSPEVGAIYGILSGDKKVNNRNTMWDPMFEDQTINNIANAILPHTNSQYIALKASFKPMEDVTVSGVWGYYLLWVKDQAGFLPSTYGPLLPPPAFGPPGFYALSDNNDKYLGQALDITTTYDYTEDVQFGMTLGYFNPGTAFDKTAAPNWKFDENAVQMIGSMKVTF